MGDSHARILVGPGRQLLSEGFGVRTSRLTLAWSPLSRIYSPPRHAHSAYSCTIRAHRRKIAISHLTYPNIYHTMQGQVKGGFHARFRFGDSARVGARGACGFERS